ncbi:MAG: hypothetical protein WCQ90_02340 [Deltaproteobacteria bacterium]
MEEKVAGLITTGCYRIVDKLGSSVNICWIQKRITTKEIWCGFMHKVLLAIIALSISSIASAADTLCSPQEKIVFSCSTGKKIASVCASANLSPTTGYIQYRFGKKGLPELIVPDTTGIHPSKITNGGTITFSGGGGDFLRFIKGQYGYVVYDTVSGKAGDKAGVNVEKNGKVIADLTCKGEVTSEIRPELFQKAGIPEGEY